MGPRPQRCFTCRQPGHLAREIIKGTYRTPRTSVKPNAVARRRPQGGPSEGWKLDSGSSLSLIQQGILSQASHVSRVEMPNPCSYHIQAQSLLTCYRRLVSPVIYFLTSLPASVHTKSHPRMLFRCAIQV